MQKCSGRVPWGPESARRLGQMTAGKSAAGMAPESEPLSENKSGRRSELRRVGGWALWSERTWERRSAPWWAIGWVRRLAPWWAALWAKVSVRWTEHRWAIALGWPSAARSLEEGQFQIPLCKPRLTEARDSDGLVENRSGGGSEQPEVSSGWRVVEVQGGGQCQRVAAP